MCEFSCEACHHDPSLKQDLGCESSTQRVVWTDAHEEMFYNCPLLWVTRDIIDWYQEHKYDIEIGNPLNFWKQSTKYVEAWQVYKAYYEKYQVYQTEKRMKKNKGPDPLDTMGANFMAQKRNSNG